MKQRRASSWIHNRRRQVETG